MARAPKEEIKPGDLLGGKYRIEGVIGQGGMGVVASARHTELHQRVAIKVLPTHLAADKDLVERFMREARASARLRSEHAVKVVDVGTRTNGSPYIVMELLEGEDLGALVERGPLPIPDAVDFVLQACEAVAEAHAMGIVHRDLKPRNLFLTTKLHGKTLVKVLDFGLAKRIDMQDRKLTATAAVMGSPQYMSPEQMKGSADIDFRTDVWSLGVCLYELISARIPFDAVAVPVLCAMVLKDDPVPLPNVRPDVPLALWHVIQKCLMKRPADRYTTVSDLATALEPFAPLHAQGAAQRISAVLFAVAKPGGDRDRGLDPEDHEKDTRSNATFDSDPRGERALSTPALLGVIGFCAFAAIVGGVLIVKGLQPSPIEQAREPSRYEPEVADLVPGANGQPRSKDPDARSASSAGHTSGTSGPTTTLGIGQLKGPKPAGSGRPLTPNPPASVNPNGVF